MNKIYEKDNKKDKFIADHLLPYIIKHIEVSDDPYETVDKVASMFIFPYKTKEGVRIGSLKESGVCWYFIKDEKDKTLSSGSYRIFADEVLKPEQATKFRQTFGEYDCISEFSDTAVIKDLIGRMSQEEDYTELWWTYAYDVLKLWNHEKFSVSLSVATKNIDNNGFLFVEGYCDEHIKSKLIEFGVFKDVVDIASKSLFWDKISRSERDKAITVLKNMGVPHTFTTDNEVNANILSFVREISDKMDFPISESEVDYDKCNLCHSLFMNLILRESQKGFKGVVQDKDYNSGIVIKNSIGDYVPLSWDLFYSYSDFEEEENKDGEEEMYSLEDELSEESASASENDNKLEQLHVEVTLYDNYIIDCMENLHEFSNVVEVADDYNHGIEVEIAEFYKWIWSYSHHSVLAENILYYFSSAEDGRKTVPEEFNDFVLTVIGTDSVDDAGYCFDIDLQAKTAFEFSNVINKISRDFDEVYGVIYSDFETMDVSDLIPQIVAATISDSTVKSRIVTDSIWDHVYLAEGENNCFDDIYVRGKIFEEDYEDALVLWPSNDRDSYIRALASYVTDTYNAQVTIAAAESFDWKSEYMNLIKDIRSFISEQRDVKSIDDIYGYVAEMEDIRNFGDEKRAWVNLINQRDKIIAQEVGKSPGDFGGWRDFLSVKYKGRCQLCGGKTITGEQNAHFFTYRIVKESENFLANMSSNMFCLCPSCHGEMGYGSFMGKDMTEILEKSKMYAEYIEEKLANEEMEDDYPCLVQELVDEDIVLEGFHNPIVCKVIINGKERDMAFSWEHFMKIAFVLSKLNDSEE